MNEICMPMLVGFRVVKDCNIMKEHGKPKSKWMKSPSCDITIILFNTIQPCNHSTWLDIPRLPDLDESIINNSDTS